MVFHEKFGTCQTRAVCHLLLPMHTADCLHCACSSREHALTSTVGLPLESKICLAKMLLIVLMIAWWVLCQIKTEVQQDRRNLDQKDEILGYRKECGNLSACRPRMCGSEHWQADGAIRSL